MARHDQRPDPGAMTCPSCKRGDCRGCVDVDRAHVGLLASRGAVCTCGRSNHPSDVAEAASGDHAARDDAAMDARAEADADARSLGYADDDERTEAEHDAAVETHGDV